MKRQAITSLHPLTTTQVQYLMRMGEHSGDYHRPYGDQLWWVTYYNIPVSAYEDPGYPLPTPPPVFKLFAEELAEQLQKAKKDPFVFQQLSQAGSLPPPGTLPSGGSRRGAGGSPYARYVGSMSIYELPDYFGWWQGENAFRRGFMNAWDAQNLSNLKAEIQAEVSRVNGLTSAAMRKVGDSFRHDPVVHFFFNELADNFDQGTAKDYKKLSELMNDVRDARDRAYQQFLPTYKALRWVPGAGLMGLGRRRR